MNTDKPPRAPRTPGRKLVEPQMDADGRGLNMRKTTTDFTDYTDEEPAFEICEICEICGSISSAFSICVHLRPSAVPTSLGVLGALGGS